MRRHVAIAALAHSLVRLVAHGSIVPDFITDNILDVRVVCPPDSFVCPHGGRAFRDKRHDCAFTPCEFVTPGTPAPATTLTIDELRRESASEWFRYEEFVVPRVRGRDLVRGKRVAARVTASLRLMSRRALHWRASYTFATTVDVVVLAPSGPESNRTAAHTSILADALSSGTDAPLSPRDPLRLVARQAPWSRYAFFGWLARQWSVASVRAMLEVVQYANSLEAFVRSKPASWSLDEFFARVKPQVIVAVPTLVVAASDESERLRRASRDGDRQGSSDSAPLAHNATGDWFASQSETLQHRVLAFVEHQLWTLGHLELAPVGANSSVGSASGTADSDRLNVRASVRFTAQYSGASASVAVFLTPFDALVGRGDEDSDKTSSAQTEETYAGDFASAATPRNASLSMVSDAATVWNFTLLTCDELHAKHLQELHARVLLTVLRANRSSTSHNDTRDNDSSSSASAAFSNGNNSNDDSSVVVSCWVYQPIEHAVPVGVVQYVHHR